MKDRGLSVDTAKIEAHASNFVEERLGLDHMTYERIWGEVDVVIHAAWPVHFASSLVSFEDSIRGTWPLLSLVSLTYHRNKKLDRPHSRSS